MFIEIIVSFISKCSTALLTFAVLKNSPPPAEDVPKVAFKTFDTGKNVSEFARLTKDEKHMYRPAHRPMVNGSTEKFGTCINHLT